MRALGAILFTMAVVSPALGDSVNPFDPNSTWPGARERARAMARPVPIPAPQLGSPSRLLPPGALAAPTRLATPAPARLDGGPRPAIAPLGPQSIAYSGGEPAGTVVIDTGGRQLLLVTSGASALRYPISVGREGFTWTGSQTISRVADWPDWHPPAEMRQRDPRLPEVMTGGIRNPLGAKALYLGNTLYRIHGTNDTRSIGQAASSGCFRMMNGHVVDLADRIGVGTRVVVKSGLPATAVSGGTRKQHG